MCSGPLFLDPFFVHRCTSSLPKPICKHHDGKEALCCRSSETRTDIPNFHGTETSKLPGYSTSSNHRFSWHTKQHLMLVPTILEKVKSNAVPCRRLSTVRLLEVAEHQADVGRWLLGGSGGGVAREDCQRGSEKERELHFEYYSKCWRTERV
ncbi:hypothetical protein BJX96DRAFT_140398 [Aspergillus floccosus]